MSNLSLVINCGLGDAFISRFLLEDIKSKYEEIIVYYNKDVLESYRNNEQEYYSFTHQIGTMVFNQTPLIYGGFKYFEPNLGDIHEFDLMSNKYNQQPVSRPNLSYYCVGNPLDIGEYIVITTKVRMLHKNLFLVLHSQFWEIINNSSYKVVLLGEKIVETNLEYSGLPNQVYSIYDIIINNVMPEKIVDLTIPALGKTSPNFNQMRQDLLIMQNAKRNVIFGEGGNLWMSLAVGNTLAYRQSNDDDPVGKTVRLLSNYQETFITKNWDQFIERSKIWIQSAV